MAENNQMELAAASILQRAVELDRNKRFTEALVCYQEGLQLLVDQMKGMDVEKKKALRPKVEGYMGRAEQIKKHVEEHKQLGDYHEQINITNDSIGHSYKTVVGRFLDNEVSSVRIEDPYVRIHHQCQNYLRFCELLVKKCRFLRYITLVTTPDPKCYNDQNSWLNIIKTSLQNTHSVVMEVEFSQTLHDRQIILSNGWVVKIGRGLDYFKPAENKFSIGFFDYDLRPCHETNIDIFHSKDVIFKTR